jgi:hypothetical protein
VADAGASGCGVILAAMAPCAAAATIALS